MSSSSRVDQVWKELHQFVDPSSNILSTKDVLLRPTFSFLHRLLLMILLPQQVYASHTSPSLRLEDLKTKESKAAFLTRALAWVSFVLDNDHYAEDHVINVLFLVSPVQILAGVAVANTHEFLVQLCQAAKSKDVKKKIKAVKKMDALGVRALYTIGVTARKGVVQCQALGRGYIVRSRNVVSKYVSEMNVVIQVGMEFEKDFGSEWGGIYRGIVQRKVGDGRYLVFYPQDEDEEELEEAELRMLLTPSTSVTEEKPELELRIEHPLCTRESESQSRPSTGLSEKVTFQGHASSPSKLLMNEEVTWQVKFRAILNQGREDLKPHEEEHVSLEHQEVRDIVDPVNPMTKEFHRSIPVLPQLHVPGGKESWQKRLKPNKAMKKPKRTKASKLPSLQLSGEGSKNKQQSSSEAKKAAKQSLHPKLQRLEPHRMNLGKVLHSVNHSNPNAGTHQPPSPLARELTRVIVNKIYQYLRRKKLRLRDLFRQVDTKQSGIIRVADVSRCLLQIDFPLQHVQVEKFVQSLDIERTGMVDVDEFEQYIQIFRCQTLKTKQLRQELNPIQTRKKPSAVSSSKSQSYVTLLPYRTRLIDLFHALDDFQEEQMSVAKYRAGLRRLKLPAVHSSAIDDLFDQCHRVPSRADHDPPSSPETEVSMLHLHQLLQVVHSAKDQKQNKNKFIDSKWMTTFDKQMEQALEDID